MGRGLIAALVASLALNVFAVGFISGRVIGDGPPEPPKDTPEFAPSYHMLHEADVLPPERREAFREAFRAQLPSMRAHFEEMRTMRRDLGELLWRKDWDRAAIEAKMQEMQDLQNQQQEAFEKAFLNAFETLTPEERALMHEAYDRRRAGHRRRHMPHGDMAPPPEGE